MCEQSGFHTQKGYELADENSLTTAMEDYLEMIFRLSKDVGYTRVSSLAEHLNVKPSSASKMTDNLKSLGYVQAGKYGYIKLTERGESVGRYLLYRHDLLNRFLCCINQSTDELEQAERIEHYVDERTVHSIDRFLQDHLD